MQKIHNSSAFALELCHFCIKPSIPSYMTSKHTEPEYKPRVFSQQIPMLDNKYYEMITQIGITANWTK